MLTTINSALAEWKPIGAPTAGFFSVLTTIALTTVIIVSISIYYCLQMKKLDVKKSPQGLALVVHRFVEMVKKLVIDMMGKESEYLTPYFVYIFAYLMIGNTLSIVGLGAISSSYTVGFSMAFVTFIGMFVFGIKYQGISYFNRYLVTIKTKFGEIPVFIQIFNIIGDMILPISMSFRIWGNITAGSIILSMVYGTVGSIGTLIMKDAGWFTLFSSIFTPVFHLYFDAFAAVIQSLVFSMLTLVNWNFIPASPTSKIETDSMSKGIIKHEVSIA